VLKSSHGVGCGSRIVGIGSGMGVDDVTRVERGREGGGNRNMFVFFQEIWPESKKFIKMDGG
jgi:hypothetical protein